MISLLIIYTRMAKLSPIQRLYYTKWVFESEERLVTCLFVVTIQWFNIKDEKRAKYPFYYNYKTFWI